jgi:hypothetical protein
MALAARSLGVSPDDLTRPIVTAGDLVPVYAIVKPLVDGRWFTPNPALGAPFNQDLSTYPTLDHVHLAVIGVLARATENPFLALNTYLLLSFGLGAAVAYLVFRVIGVRRVVSLPLALSFGIHPWPFARIGNHAFLVHTWSLALGSLLAYLIASGSIERAWTRAASVRGRRVGIMLCLVALSVVLAGTGVYYAFFSAVLCVTALVLRAALSPRPRAWVPLTTAAFGVPVFVAAGLYLQAIAGKSVVTTGTVVRLPSESVYYAGSLSSLLLPSPVSGVDRLASLRRSFDALVGQGQEWEQNSLVGVLAVTVLLLWVGLLLLRTSLPTRSTGFAADWTRDPKSAPWALFALVSLLFFVPYGLGALVAFVVSPEIRVWGRLFPLIVFCSMTVLALLGDRLVAVWRSGLRQWVAGALVTLLTLVVFWDQVLPSVPRLDSTEAFVAEVAGLAAEIEVRSPDCAVLQVPTFPFPENGAVNGWSDYDHLWPYLYSSRTSTTTWSYGALKGTAEGDWQLPLLGAPPSDLADAARVAGFCGLLVDTAAYDEQERQGVLATLEGEFGTPVGSQTGRWQYFVVPSVPSDPGQRDDLLTPVFLVPRSDGFDSPGPIPESLWLVQREGVITVANSGADSRVTTVGLLISPPPCTRHLSVTVTSAGTSTSTGVATAAEPISLNVAVEVPSLGRRSVEVAVAGDGCQVPSEGRTLFGSVSILTSPGQVEVFR